MSEQCPQDGRYLLQVDYILDQRNQIFKPSGPPHCGSACKWFLNLKPAWSMPNETNRTHLHPTLPENIVPDIAAFVPLPAILLTLWV